MRERFCGITPGELANRISEAGFPEKQALVAVMNFYRRKIHDFPAMDNLPLTMRNYLAENFTTGLQSFTFRSGSEDRSVKYLFNSDGNRMHESVFIPGGKRKTLCISSQSGCRMGCPFCLTGKTGFRGNLTAGEILNQILSVPASGEITHVVFMGMGEPLDNTDEVLKACRIITAEWGLALSPSHVTVSTVGITEAVKRFLGETQCNLALSLYSPFPDERMATLPAERQWPASEIIEMMKEFPAGKRRRFTIAYLMIDGVNDSLEHLEALTEMLSGTSLRVNLLPYHPTGEGDTRPSSPGKMAFFRNRLMDAGISASVRLSRGEDISAACGMLAYINK